jgi:hypothetical protein
VEDYTVVYSEQWLNYKLQSKNTENYLRPLLLQFI